MTSVVSSLPFLPARPAPVQGDQMLELFAGMLDVRVRSVEPRVAKDGSDRANLEELKAGISKLRSMALSSEVSWSSAWNEGYRLESLLALLEPAETLSLDLDRRLNEAIARKLPSVERLKIDVNAAKTAPQGSDGGAANLRNTLVNLLEELHWEDQRKFFKTPILKTAVHRIVLLDLLAFVLVILPYAWIFVRSSQNRVDLSSFWAALPLYTVITSGAFGAYFSRLIDIQRKGDGLSLRGLQAMKLWSSLFLRGAVGMCGAVVVFFFLRSGLLAGGVFPDFTKLGFDYHTYSALMLQSTGGPDTAKATDIMHTIEPSQSLALLAMWSFVAGFSERLVPTILSKTEASFSDAASGVSGNTNAASVGANTNK